MPRPLIILGSSRTHGETRRAVDLAFPSSVADLFDLSERQLSPYDYEHRNAGDEFSSIVDAVLNATDIVFASPVYWYSMSAQLKGFFDRLSDLTTIRKAEGRSLAGRQSWMIATGTDEELPQGFEVPFERTSQYFGLTYRGGVYLYTGSDAQLRESTEHAVARFGEGVLNSKK